MERLFFGSTKRPQIFREMSGADHGYNYDANYKGMDDVSDVFAWYEKIILKRCRNCNSKG